MKQSAHAELFKTYEQRINQIGPQIGFGPCQLTEFDENSKPDRLAKAIQSPIQTANLCITLEENGRQFSSPKFADQLQTWSDQGHQDLMFAIGDAHGLPPAVTQKSDLSLSLGPMTYPHLLARVILMEQIYRALCILKGHPYHHT